MGKLLWKGKKWRTLNADEREFLMGYPEGYTKSLGDNDSRCCAIGNSFHVPAIRLLVAMIYGLQVPVSANRSNTPEGF